PTLVLPFFDPTSSLGGPGGTGGVFAAGNLHGSPLVGHVDLRTATQGGGSDLNVSSGLSRGDPWCIQGVAGLSYLGLNERFQEYASVTSSAGGTTYDRFGTDNQFYGGQVGLRLTGDCGWLKPTLTTKVALGATQETLDISGNAVLPSNSVLPRGAHQQPGGFY